MSAIASPAGLLGWIPSVDVHPTTADGCCNLAREALVVGDRAYLDRIELTLLQLLKITPDCQDACEKALAQSIVHTPEGLRVRWQLTTGGCKCAACEGGGFLTAEGSNGREYEVGCPACHGSGDEEEDVETRTVLTDIDGHFLEEVYGD